MSSSKIDSESLGKWVVALCTIRFDLERGQLIEECLPRGALSQAEELSVSFSSFPDSVSQQHIAHRSAIHDCIFFFRFKRSPNSISTSNVTIINQNNGNGSGIKGSSFNNSSSSSSDRDSDFLYGFVFNRQRHDERLKRGGEQKSVVILSRFPYSSVFRPLLQIMGPLYFDIGTKALDHIAGFLSKWPCPVPGKLMELPIGNATLKVNLPPSHSLPLNGGFTNEGFSSSMAPFLPNNQSVPQGLFHDSDIFGIYKGLLLQLWLLWELLIIGEPVLIIAPTPPQCSEAVAALVSLVAPLLCSVDFRPYFTIHDSEFAKLNSITEGNLFPSMVLGVTNLFFLKSLRNISHIVSVGSPSLSSTRVSFAPRSSSARVSGLGLQNLSFKRFSPTNLLNAVKLRRDGPLCLMTEHKEAVWSSYSATTKPDTSILNRLIDAGISPRVEESMSVVNNEILRRHFLELTTNFLSPFGPYFRVITPSEGSSPFVDPPPLSPFNADEFLGGLSARGPGKFLSKRMRSNWLDLYRRFLKGQNFMPWFQRRRAVAEEEQHKLWRQARMKTDARQFISKMSELEMVDSFNAIERHLLGEMQSGNTDANSAVACQKLKGDLEAVFNVLPYDTQQSLLLNPQRAALLQATDQGMKEHNGHFAQVGVIFSTSDRRHLQHEENKLAF